MSARAASPELRYSLSIADRRGSAPPAPRPFLGKRLSTSLNSSGSGGGGAHTRPPSPAPPGFKTSSRRGSGGGGIDGFSPISLRTEEASPTSTVMFARRASVAAFGRGRSPSPTPAPTPRGLVRAASPSPCFLPPRAQSPSPKAPSAASMATDPPPNDGIARDGPLIVRGFDAPALGPKIGSRPSSPSAMSSTTLRSKRSSSNMTRGGRSSCGGSGSDGSGARSAGPIVRPRASLLDRTADQRLEVRASRDFEQIDEYYATSDDRPTSQSGRSANEVVMSVSVLSPAAPERESFSKGSVSGHGGGVCPAEEWLPPHLAAYLIDQPLPTAVYAHSSLTEPLKPNSPVKLARPVYENPAMRTLLHQGTGGKARYSGAGTEQPPIASSLSETLNERNQVKLRSWLAAGLDEAVGTQYHSHRPSHHASSAAVRNGLSSPLHIPMPPPAMSRKNSTKPFPSPGLRSPALASVMMTMKASGDGNGGGGSFPFGFSSTHDSNGKATAADSTTTVNSNSSSSVSTGLSRRTSVSSNSTAATSTAATSRWSSRHISLQLATSINFSKTHWRGTVYPDLGVTILTQMPASAVANGAFGVAEYEEDRDVRDVPASFASTAAVAAAADEGTVEENAEALAALQRECAEGVLAWEEASTVAGKMEQDDGINLEDLEPPESEDDEDEIEDSSESDAPEGSETSSALSEASKLPPSVLLARERIGKHVDAEPIGDNEISISGAHDSTSLEGMAYTLWHSPIGCFRVNRDLSITQANPKWRQACGLQDGESNDSWPAMVHPDDRDKVVAHYSKIAETLPLERDEYEFRWLPDGTRDRWCMCVIEPAVINGVLAGYSGFLININKHKARQTAMALREEQLRNELALMSQTTSVGLVRIDCKGKILTANKAWYDVVRLKEDQPPERWVDAMHPDDKEWVIESWAKSLETLQPFSARFRWKYGDTCLTEAVPNNSDPSKVTGWIASVTNVTAQTRAEEELIKLSKEREERAKRDVEEAQERTRIAIEEKRQQELLIDVTSHEIRNPISAVLQNAEVTRTSLQSIRATLEQLKKKDALPAQLGEDVLHDLEEDIEALDAISECGMAQERIANDILGLAQLQLNKYSVTPIEFDLATSLRNILRMFKNECRTKSIELQLVIGSSLARLGPRARVFADPARLTQVLVNLLSNAIRFTAKSDTRIVTLAVEVSAKAPDRDAPLIPPEETEYYIDQQKPIYLFFSVEDTGPGMTKEESSRLFAKFMQASPFTHTTWGGSGLGLWIARNLCELQAGRIEVSSTVGKGSIFRCFITARSVDAGTHADQKPVAVIEGITSPNAARGAAPKVFLSKNGTEEKPLSGYTILCCEDNQINRTVLRRQLDKEGCDEVLLACDGKEGVDLLMARKPGAIDCILMDIEMPIMDGLAATRAIRAAEKSGERTGHQRIVGLTGNARNAQKQTAMKAGMDTVITKPYKVADLVDKIRDTYPDEESFDTSMNSTEAGADTSYRAPAADSNGKRDTKEMSHTFRDGVTVEVIAGGNSRHSKSSPREVPSKPCDRTGRKLLAPELKSGHIDGAAHQAAESMGHHGAGTIAPPSKGGDWPLPKTF
ncbi:hypothetical protein JCM3774_003906 [Rhodotorula dairenensis]